MEIEVRHDSKRGCGWRKPGGLYFVSGGVSRGCGMLPKLLDVCPTCHAGIKPSRGFTWIDTRAVCDPAVVALMCQKEHCSICPLGGNAGKHGLIWIGGQFYKRPSDWTAEAARQGVSRRIAAVPKDFVLGQTWILVAHREAIQKVGPVIDGAPAYDPGIFHAFQPAAIEYVVKGDETEEELAKLRKRGITPVQVVRHGEQSELAEGQEDETLAEEEVVNG